MKKRTLKVTNDFVAMDIRQSLLFLGEITGDLLANLPGRLTYFLSFVSGSKVRSQIDTDWQSTQIILIHDFL